MNARVRKKVRRRHAAALAVQLREWDDIDRQTRRLDWISGRQGASLRVQGLIDAGILAADDGPGETEVARLAEGVGAAHAARVARALVETTSPESVYQTIMRRTQRTLQKNIISQIMRPTNTISDLFKGYDAPGFSITWST